MSVLLSVLLMVTFVPAQVLAAPADQGADSVLSTSGDEPTGGEAGGTARPNAGNDTGSNGSAVNPDVAGDTESTPAGASEGSDIDDGEGAPAAHFTDSLASIIEDDAAGNPHAQMYTTLLDQDGKIVDTNDPTRTVDEKYKPTDQGGQSAGLSKGDGVTVHFRMAAVTPHDADGAGTGVQEDTTYTMDLPWQLVAAKEDKNGNKLVDADTPLDFFNSGDVTAKGGLCTKHGVEGNPVMNETGDPLYELHIDFSNVANRVDISGEFQYATTVSQNVTGGSLVTLTYVPGGTVSFKVNEDATPSIGGEYGATISAGSGGPTSYYVCSNLSKTPSSDATDDPFGYKDVTISTGDNMGVWVDESAWAQDSPAAGNVFNAYGDKSGPYFSLGVTFAEKNESGGNKGAWVSAKPENIIENGKGKTVVRFSADGLQVDVAFSSDDALKGSLIQAYTNSYIATKYTVCITDGQGHEAKGVRNLQLYVPTVLAGDYEGTSLSSPLDLHATADTLDALDATGSLDVSLGDFKTPNGSTATFNPATGLESASASVCTWLGSNSGSYRGNYYWMDFTPATYNDTGMNFYASMASFLPNKSLESDYTWLDNSGGYVMDDGTTSTFMTGGAGPGTQTVGLTGSNYWQYAGTVSVGQVQGDDHLVANSCFSSGSFGDSKLQYQIKQVFADADPSQQLVVYCSADQNGNLYRNPYGDVMYIVVDPRTNANAQRQQDMSDRSWYDYRAERGSNGTESAKGGSWRLHVFNAPQSELQVTFPQYEGAFDVSDQAKSGHIEDGVQVGNGSFDASARTSQTISYGVSTKQASYMNAEWVGDDTIFWTMTMNAENWQQWTDGKLYVSADRPLQVVSAPPSAKVSGHDVSGGYAFAKNQDGSWESVASGMSTGFYQAPWDQMCDGASIEQKSSSNNFNITIDRNAFDIDSSTGRKTITVGFFTKVTGASSQYDGTFKATAQLVCHTGDATLIAGDGHNSWPTSANGTGSSGYNFGQWAYRVSATGSAFTPNLYKSSAESSSASDPSNIATTWTLTANGFNSGDNQYKHTGSDNYLLNGFYGGWTGRFAIGDTMSGSKVTDADGKAVNVNAGKYTHVARMFASKYPSVNEAQNGGGCGPIPSKGMGGDAWQKYVNGDWEDMNPVDCYWDADAPGVYRAILTTSPGGGTTNSESNPIAVYVYYAGNMADSILDAVGSYVLHDAGANYSDPVFNSNSLAIEYRGLDKVKYVGGDGQLDYQTELDTKALVEAAAAAQGKTGIDAEAALYNVELSNAAGFGTWRITGTKAATSSVSKTATAGLSIKKEAKGPAAINEGNGGMYASYAIDTQVGFSPAAYVNVEDHISKVVDSGNLANGSGAATYDVSDAATATQQDKDAIAALAKATKVKNLKVTVTEPGKYSQTVGTYDDAAGTFVFADGWKSSTLTVGGYSDEPGSLFHGQIMRDADADGNPQPLSAQTKVSIAYDLYLDIDAAAKGDTSFRESDFYHGGTLTLYNHAESERPYDTVGGANTASVAAASADDAVAGDDAATAAGELAHVGDMYAQSVDDGISLAGGEIDEVDGMLRVWPDADVSREFLVDQTVAKTPVATSADKSHTEWMFYDWTGTLGKHGPTVKLTDMTSTLIEDLWSDVEGMTDAQKLAKRQQLADLLVKHTTVSDLKLYLVGKDEKPSASNGSTSLAGKTPIYAIDGTLSSASDRIDTTADGRMVSFAYEQGGPATSDNDSGGKDVFATGSGFIVTAADLPFDSYLASTYSTDIDWDGFYQEAMEKGLLDGAGDAVGTDRAPRFDVKNAVAGDRNQKADASAGQVKVESATFSKSVKGVNRGDGTASWRLYAKTSKSVAPSELTFADEPAFAADNDAAAVAARAATSIKDVTISCEGTAIYKDGALTDAARDAGWTDANVSVATEGLHLSVVLKNTDGAKVLDKGQTYEVTYRTVLDKDAFVSALVDAGGSMADAAYTIQNAATLSTGGAALSGEATANFKPNLPVTATKSSYTTPQNGNETQSAAFTVTAGTGEAARKGFTLADTLSGMSGPNNSAAAAQKAMMLSAFTAKVTLADGSEQTLSAEQILNGEIDGVSLAMADGGALTMNVPGTFGKDRGWKLTFDKLPAGATVSVDYTLTVDRAAYVAAGGDLDGVVNFRNAFNVGTADGATAGASSTGKVKVQPDVSKKGVVESGKSEAGNPLIDWTVDARLHQIFSATELANLETASIKDTLDQRLRYVGVSVADRHTTMNGFSSTPLAEGTDYTATFDETTHTLEVKIKEPSKHPDVRITIKTEVIGSTEGISNSVDMYVDGELKGGDKTEVKKDLIAVTEYGSVTSAATPTWQAEATKLVDGGQGQTPAGAFAFTLTQVDEYGNAIEGGQTAEAANDADGKISFDELTYGPRNIAGTYWYQIAEKTTDDVSANYKVDDSVKTVKVTLQKGTDGDYLLSSEIMGVGDGATVAEATFDNISRQDLRLAKVDLAGNALDGASFKVAPAEGSTFADGTTDALEVGSGVQAKALLAGNAYTVSEKEAPAGYEKLAGSLTFIASSNGAYEVVLADEGWSLGADGVTVTAADAKYATWAPSAKKLVDGAAPAADLAGKFTFTATEVDELGNEVESGYNATATNAGDGSVTFDSITYDAAGTHYYRIVEEPNTADDGFVYDQTAYTVKVEVSQAADRSWSVEESVIAPYGADTVIFDNKIKPENPGTPNNPDTPETSETPESPDALDSENALDKTSDTAPLVPLMALVLGSLGMAVACIRRMGRD